MAGHPKGAVRKKIDNISSHTSGIGIFFNKPRPHLTTSPQSPENSPHKFPAITKIDVRNDVVLSVSRMKGCK